jgi:hypothetical protein
MGPRPSPVHTLDRYPNNDGDYEPMNCQWRTHQENNFNRRANRIIEFSGLALPLAKWAQRTGIPRETICSRLRQKWSIERALTTPVDQERSRSAEKTRQTKLVKKITFRGETRNIEEWSAITRVPTRRISWRPLRGWPIEKAVYSMTKRAAYTQTHASAK